MPTVRRVRTLAADPEALWAVVADPHHLPRYWPRVRRVEDVRDDAFTLVLVSDRGRAVRADFVVVEHEPPCRRSWRQQLAGTPFERILTESQTTVDISPAPEGSTVTLELRQRGRGLARLGGFMLRRAGRAQLDEALDGVAGICG